MAGNNLLTRYIWIVDTLRRVGRISRKELSARWQLSARSDGRPRARPTL